MKPDNLDNIRSQWDEANASLHTLDEENLKLSQKVLLGRMITARERLIGKYRRFSILSAIMTLLWPLYCRMDIFSSTYPWVLAVAGCIFFAIASVTDFTLYQGLLGIDVATMPVNKVATIARKMRRRHRRYMLFGIPMAALMVVLMIISLNNDSGIGNGALYGIFVGLVFGAIIAILLYKNMMNQYRRMINDD